MSHEIANKRKVVEIEANSMAGPLEDYILENDFRILKSLGCGTFGEVRLACHLPTNTQVAVKMIAKKQNSLAHNVPEVEILQFLEHRNIVRFFHSIETLQIFYVVMEYVEGQDLEMFIRDIDYLKEEEARPIFQQVVTAVHFLHERLIAHREIKLENILIDGAGNIKLCDFGMATRLKEGEMLMKVCGTLLYMAPEMLAGEPYDGLAVDMWSLGVVLYVLVTGKFPYEETTCPALSRLITTTNYPTPYYLSKPCLITIAQLLTVPSQHRITICQLLERRWLGHIEEHGEPASKEIHLSVVENMCNIGYISEEIVSSLRHREEPVNQPFQPLEKLETVTFRRWIWKEQERSRSYIMINKSTYRELVPRSDEIIPEGGVPMANVFTNATVHIAVYQHQIQ
ncbi:sperm motility kinase-like [Cricetulus griseus]|uniref:non-specific serine/threonine protein kinase n=1 Tax=Cricetulus griseus TaxID=10029 RepID=A0A9J7GRB5_CRIGR|nr:sperm motility kinase-like [Cricetulus griseus]